MEYIDTVGFAADQGGRGFHLPVAMAVRNDGKIYVASRSHAEARNIIGVQVVSLKHEFFGTIGSYGQGGGQMISPSALTIDQQKNLYLADDYLQRITIFDQNGNYLTHWGVAGNGKGEFNGPSGLVFDANDNLLLVDHKNHRIQIFAKDGTYLGQFGAFGDNDGQFDHPWGITVGHNGFIYIADWRNNRIQKLTSNGEFISKFGIYGSGEGELNRPSDIAVDATGNMYITDWGNQRVQIWGSDGTFINSLRGQATLSPWAQQYLEANLDELRARENYVSVYPVDTDEPDEISARIESYFWDPVAITLDTQERLYVLETGRDRFQVYQKDLPT